MHIPYLTAQCVEAPHQRHVLEVGPAPVRGPDRQLELEIPRRIHVCHIQRKQ